MSVEVESGAYKFMPDEKDPPVLFKPPVQTASADEPMLFRYGMIHDLESLWWIAVWFLFHTHPIGTPYNPEVLNIADLIFTRHYNRDARYEMLRGESQWYSSIPILPAEFSALAGRLGNFRDHYIMMATKTFESLTPEGIAYKISTEYLTGEQKDLDAYDIVKACFHTDPLAVALITLPKRKDAPAHADHAEPDKPSGSKRIRRR
jgi:hypothetical protein